MVSTPLDHQETPLDHQGSARPPEPDQEPHDESGLDLARSIARGLAGRTQKQEPAARERALRRARRRPRDATSSGAQPDERDPQTLDVTLERFVGEQGWETELRVHGVFARWSALVGNEVAEHARPESFADGRLVVRTDSTAWATQMKLLAGGPRPTSQRGARRRHRDRHRRGRTSGAVVVAGPAAGQGPGSARHLRLRPLVGR